MNNYSAKELIEEIKKIKNDKIILGELKPEKKWEDIPKIQNPKHPDWIYERLGNYCLKITDYIASGSFAKIKENVLISNQENYAIMVKTADFSNNFTKGLTYTDKHGYDFLKNSNLFGGEIILSNIGSIGKVFKVPKLNRPMTLASNTIMLRPAFEEIADYLYYYFLSSRGYNQLKSISSGTSIQKFNKTDLKKIIIPIPSYKEQLSIIKEFNTIDYAITNRKQMLIEYDNLISSKFYEMFSKYINNGEVYNLFDLCEIITDGTHQTPTYVKEGIIFLSSKDVVSKKINWDSVKYISKDLHLELKRRVAPRKNDILLAKNGTTGIAALVDRDEIFDIYVSLALIRLKKNINPIFMLYQLNSEFCKKQFDQSLKGIGVPNLHLNKIRETKVICPELGIQNKFADYIKSIEKQKELCEEDIRDLEKLLETKMHEYFD